MKKLGERYEFDHDDSLLSVVIVEMSQFEFEQVELFLEQRDLTTEEKQRDQWVHDFGAFIGELPLSAGTKNSLMRAARWHDSAFYQQEPFDPHAWTQQVLEAHSKHGQRGRIYPPLEGPRNFGTKGYLELIGALQALP